MKYVFLGALIILVLMTIGAMVTIPDLDVRGRRTLVWVTDANPARRSQVRLFEDFAPDLTAKVDSGNLDTSKVIVQSSGGVGPDLMDCYSVYHTDTYARTGIAWDITDAAKELGISPDICWPGARNIMTWTGRQYTFPTNCGVMALFFNKDVFDELGLAYPESDWDWDEFVDVARQLTLKRESGRGYERFALNNYWWMEAVWQAGGSFYSEDGTRCVLDSAEAMDGWRFWHYLQVKWDIVPDTVEISGLVGETADYGGGQPGLFLAGRYVLYHGGRWNQIAWRQANEERAAAGKPPFHYGVVGMPRKRRRASRFVARATGINAHGKRRDDALRFLQFLASEPYCRDINITADGVSAVRKYACTLEQVWNPAYPEERECDAVWMSLMEYGVGMEVSPFVIPEDAGRIVNEYVSAVKIGTIPLDKAVTDMTNAVNEKIMRNVRTFEHLREEYERRTGRKAEPEQE